MHIRAYDYLSFWHQFTQATPPGKKKLRYERKYYFMGVIPAIHSKRISSDFFVNLYLNLLI